MRGRAMGFGKALALLLAVGGAPAMAGGRPAVGDLDGVWTNASYTRLQRPKSLKSLTLTPEEAAKYEATLAKYHGVPDGGADDKLGQNDSEFPESDGGLAHIRGQIRTSWIVSTPDGRLPYTAAAKKRFHIGERDEPEDFDNPEGRPQSERCIAANGSGPPQMSEQDANLFQIVQTRDHVAIASEKNHDVRIVPLNVKRDPNTPKGWSGDSIGHWEGATLVIETQGYAHEVIDRDFFYHSAQAQIVERLTRVSPTEIVYEFTVTDPKTFDQPWRAEMLFRKTPGPIYEYACHEGNRSIVNILTAARLGRQEAPKAPSAAAK